MDAFQAAASAIALAELCVKVAKLVRDAKNRAGTVVEELNNIVNEIDSLQNVSKLINDVTLEIRNNVLQLSPQYTQLLQEIDSGILTVVRECDGFIRRVEALVTEIQAPVASGIRNRFDAINTLRRSHNHKDEVERLRQNIRHGLNRLQAFYTSMNIIQVLTTAVSVSGVSDQVRRLGFELKSQVTQIGQHIDRIAGNYPGGLLPMTRLLGTVKFNKHFDVPRSVGGFFIGRQHLLQRLKAVFDGPQGDQSGSPKVFVIHGFPGSGKTDFAFKFAEQYRESFWGIFVMQADSHDFMVNSFKRIVQYADKKIEPNMAAAKHWLAGQEMPWLLIMDNADNPDLDLRSYFPASSSGCILITTRHRDFKIHGNVGARAFSFERLQHDEAKTVLLRAADEPSPTRPKVDSAASHISEELQCLPLALVSAGKTIRSKLCGWRDYLDWYRKNCDLISRRLGTGNGLKEVDAASLTVIPILEPHFARLERLNDRLSADALELIHTLGYFHHRNISFRLLKLVARNANKAFLVPKDDEGGETDHSSSSEPSKTFRSRALEATISMINGPPALPNVLRNVTTDSLDEHRLRAALSKLENLNLIRCDDRGSEDVLTGHKSRRSISHQGADEESGSEFGDSEYTYSLHPLVHSWVRQRHSSLWRRSVWCEAASTALAQCIVLDAKAFTGNASSASLHFDASEILPHITHARTCKTEIDLQFQANAANSGWFRKSFGGLYLSTTDRPLMTKINNAGKLVKYSLVYLLCGEFQKAADLQSQVRSFVVARRGMDDRVSIYITLALASTMQWLTEFGKATDLQSEVVTACRKVFGPHHPQTLAMVDQYGLLLLYHGRLRDCTKAHQEAFDGFTRLGAKYTRQALIAQAHLGAVRAKYMDFTLSKEMCQEAVTGLEKLNPDDDEILWAKEALALAHAELNDGPKAYELMQDVYEKREIVLGKQHPFTLWAAVNKSRALWKMGKYDEALVVLGEAREIAEITLDKHHFGYLAGEVLRACIFRDQGRYDEAQALFISIDNTHEEIKRKRGTDHADRIVALGYQLELFEMQDKYQEAIQVGQRMLEALRTINRDGLGWQHPMRQRVSEKIAELESLQSINAAPATVTSQEGLRQRFATQGSGREVSPNPQTRQTLMRFHSDDSEPQVT